MRIPNILSVLAALVSWAATADAVVVSMNIHPTNNNLLISAGINGIADTCQNPPSALRNLYFDANLDFQVLSGERIGTGNDGATFTYDSKDTFGSWFNLIDPGNEGQFWWIVSSAGSAELAAAIGGTPPLFSFEPFTFNLDGVPTLVAGLTTASPVDVGAIHITAEVKSAGGYDTVGSSAYGADGSADAYVELNFLQTAAIPEPGTAGLMALALGLAALRRRVLR